MALEEKKRPVAPPSRQTLLDRAIAYVAPEWGLRRLAARQRIHAAEKARERFARIEAAERTNSRADKWLISRLSPDSQLELDLQTARDRSRDMYQNDALGGAVDSKVNHIVGAGFTPQARVGAAAGIVTDDAADAINDQLERLYRLWSPRADVSGKRSLWQLSRLAARHNEFDGESFTVMSDVGTADKPIPLALQVVDPERVETPPGESGNPLVRLGIKYDRQGRIVSYYIRKTHPGDTKAVNLEYDEVPADRVFHVFEQWFAGQSRGLPWMVRAIQRSKDAKDLDDSTILREQVQACFAVFVEQGYGSSYDAATGAQSGVDAAGRGLEDIVPGTIRYLNPGEKTTFATPPGTAGTFQSFMTWCYRRISAAINWPFEMVLKDWSGTSFAGGRLVLADAKKSTEVGQKLMAEMWLARVWQRLVEEAVIVGAIDVDPSDYMSAPYVFNEHTWIAPRWDYALNPGEEVAADIAEIDAGLALYEEKLGKRGYDLEDFAKRRERERRIFEQHGLKPDPQTAAAIVAPYSAPSDQRAANDQTQPAEAAA